MKRILYRTLTFLWCALATIIFIAFILLSGFIWVFTGECYIDKVDNFLSDIVDKLYDKSKKEKIK
jgi:hypothetical protein